MKLLCKPGSAMQMGRSPVSRGVYGPLLDALTSQQGDRTLGGQKKRGTQKTGPPAATCALRDPDPKLFAKQTRAPFVLGQERSGRTRGTICGEASGTATRQPAQLWQKRLGRIPPSKFQLHLTKYPS